MSSRFLAGRNETQQFYCRILSRNGTLTALWHLLKPNLNPAFKRSIQNMKRTILTLILLCTMGLPIARASDLDPRFEGVWVGTETYTVEASATQQGFPPVSLQTVIVIDPASKAFGVLAGLGKGKYEGTKNSSGNKLMFNSQLTGTGRNKVTFVLSSDGNTISETGFGTYPC